jgi:hypothetical protein
MEKCLNQYPHYCHHYSLTFFVRNDELVFHHGCRCGNQMCNTFEKKMDEQGPPMIFPL